MSHKGVQTERADPLISLSRSANAQDFVSDDVRGSLGISSDEVNEAKKSSAKIYYVRFQRDCVSKPEKKKTLAQFGDRVIIEEVRDSEDIAMNAHSTLIGEWSMNAWGPEETFLPSPAHPERPGPTYHYRPRNER